MKMHILVIAVFVLLLSLWAYSPASEPPAQPQPASASIHQAGLGEPVSSGMGTSGPINQLTF